MSHDRVLSGSHWRGGAELNVSDVWVSDRGVDRPQLERASRDVKNGPRVTIREIFFLHKPSQSMVPCNHCMYLCSKFNMQDDNPRAVICLAPVPSNSAVTTT